MRRALSVGAIAALFPYTPLIAAEVVAGTCRIELPATWTVRGDKAAAANGSTLLLERTVDPEKFVSLLMRSARYEGTTEKGDGYTIVVQSAGGAAKVVHGVSGPAAQSQIACHIELTIASADALGEAKEIAAKVRPP